VGHGDPVVVRVNLAWGRVISSRAFATTGTNQLGGILTFFGCTWAGGHV
jgi:hypothetical protein